MPQNLNLVDINYKFSCGQIAFKYYAKPYSLYTYKFRNSFAEFNFFT